MKYEEFTEKLAELKAEFAQANGRDPSTMSEFEEFLSGRKTGRIRSARLRTLKGLDF